MVARAARSANAGLALPPRGGEIRGVDHIFTASRIYLIHPPGPGGANLGGGSLIHDMGRTFDPPDRRVAAMAALQHGVVSREQLLEVGLGSGAIQHRLETGRLFAVHAGVYAVGHTRLTKHGNWMAAALAGGERGLLSHWSAAQLWGLVEGRHRPIHVIVHRNSAGKRSGIHMHRTRSLHPEDRALHSRIPTTSVARTLLDVADRAHWQQMRKLFEDAQRARLLDVPALERLLERTRGRRGKRPLGRLLAEHLRLPPDTKRELEAAFARFICDRDIPEPSYNVLVGDHLVDAYWPAHDLVVELDSRAWHDTWQAHERDTRRDGELLLLGVRVLRVTWRRLEDEPDALERTLRELLSLRRAA
jgi:very-short-patch-repair endonuclease